MKKALTYLVITVCLTALSVVQAHAVNVSIQINPIDFASVGSDPEQSGVKFFKSTTEDGDF